MGMDGGVGGAQLPFRRRDSDVVHRMLTKRVRLAVQSRCYKFLAHNCSQPESASARQQNTREFHSTTNMNKSLEKAFISSFHTVSPLPLRRTLAHKTKKAAGEAGHI